MVHKRIILIKPACPACHSKQTQFRKTDGIHWCRSCGCEFKLDEQTKKPVISVAGSLTIKEGK